MTRPSEVEKSAVLNPPAFAHLGDSFLENWPMSSSSSDCTPRFSISLDSGEPFCTSQTVSTMKSRNCRYSDCQFSETSTAKLEEVTYCQKLISSNPEATCSSLKYATPEKAWPASESRNSSPNAMLRPLVTRGLCFTGPSPR